MKLKFLFSLIFIPVFLFGLFYFGSGALAATITESKNTEQCYNPNDPEKSCYHYMTSFDLSDSDMQIWSGEFLSTIYGFGDIGNDEGDYRIHMCLLKNGGSVPVVCGDEFVDHTTGPGLKAQVGYSLTLPEGELGAANTMLQVTVRIRNLDVYTAMTAHGRKLSDVSVTSDKATVGVGEQFNLTWSSDEGHHLDGEGYHRFSYSGASISCGVANGGEINNSGNTACTANQGGVAQVQVEIYGPSRSGIISLTDTVSVDIVSSEPPPQPPNTYNLNVSRTSDGSVSSSPAGILCGSDCFESYPDGTSVILTANPDMPNGFDGWGGDCSSAGDNLTCTVTMNQDRSVSAFFIGGETPEFDAVLNVNSSGANGVTITRIEGPSDIGGVTNYNRTYQNNISARLRAPNVSPSGGVFLDWSGCDSTLSPSDCNMDVNIGESRTITANYVSTGCVDGSLLREGSGGSGPWGGPGATIPTEFEPGEQYAFTIDARNTVEPETDGTLWFPNGYRLRDLSLFTSSNPSNGVPPEQNVPVTQYYFPEFTMTAPGTPGNYTLRMVMIHNSGWEYINSTTGQQCAGPPASDVEFGQVFEHPFTVTAPPLPVVEIQCNGSGDSCAIDYGDSATISWTSTGADSCTITPGTWTGTSGNESTGALFSDVVYALECEGPGGSAADSVTVDVQEPAPVTSNVSVTLPDYCISGPSATVSWVYSDPSGSPQSAYQVQIDDQPSFNSPEVDSGKVSCPNCSSYFSGTGLLAFNTTHGARVRTWNGFDEPSPWTEASACNGDGCQPNAKWKTPNHAYPNPNSPYQFTWSPSKPVEDEPIQFTDRTFFDPSSGNKAWSWIFIPAGGGSGSSSEQNPSYTFNSDGIYQVTQSVRDNAMPPGEFCTGPTQAINIQKPIPIWKEIAPR